MTLSKLQSEAEKELKNQFCDSDGDILIEELGDYKSSTGYLEHFIQDQIDKAYSKGREEEREENIDIIIDSTKLIPLMRDKDYAYDNKELKYRNEVCEDIRNETISKIKKLSIQSKRKIK